MQITKDSPPMKIHEKPKLEKFLISAKKLYLTYSKCPLELETVIQLLKKILSTYIVEKWVIVRKFHENGNPEVHVFLKLFKKANISSATFLDLKYDSFIYHGNYQSARKPNEVLEYMLKSIKSKTDSNLYYSPSMTNLISHLGNYKSLSESLIDLAENGKVVEAMDLLKKMDPDTYLKQGNKLKRQLIGIEKDATIKLETTKTFIAV